MIQGKTTITSSKNPSGGESRFAPSWSTHPKIEEAMLRYRVDLTSPADGKFGDAPKVRQIDLNLEDPLKSSVVYKTDDTDGTR